MIYLYKKRNEKESFDNFSDFADFLSAKNSKIFKKLNKNKDQ